MTAGALDFKNISYAYDGADVVRDVSMSVGAGEIVCLLGPSGCGKTTCLRIAAGLERVTRGQVFVAGRPVAADGVFVPPEERHVGLVLQDFALFPHMTVADNVAFGIQQGTKQDRYRQAVELLEQVDLRDYADVFPHQLSGGQQQRVALARALAPKPLVMLMDEPFSGLDVTLRADVREKTISVLKRQGIPTLIVTHDPDEALALADRIIIMHEGRIRQAGTPEDVYLRPVDPYVMTFFGAPNHLTAMAEKGALTTPFGVISPVDLHDGEKADIFFRGTAIMLDRSGGGYEAVVKEARLQGPVQRLKVEMKENGICFVMEHPRRDAVCVGDHISVTADLHEFHVFITHHPRVEKVSSV